MSTFNSPKYRSLTVKFSSREKVRFVNGTVEVEGDLADRLSDYAARHPEFEITREGSAPARKTPKQELQEQARGLDLDDSGTVKELQARIAAALDDNDGDDGEDDGENEDDPDADENPDE